MELTPEQLKSLRDLKQLPDSDDIRYKEIIKKSLIENELILYLLNNKELEEIRNIQKYYRKIGYEVFDNTDSNLKNIFKDMSKSDIRDNFIEFNEYKEFCEYKDCMHINEKKCAIKENVENNTILKSRYDNYLKFIEKR